MKIPRRRVRAWLSALEKARITAERLAYRLGRVTAILYGSYARGDFNLWSDIDLIVVSKAFEGARPLDRYDMVSDLLEANVEPLLLTPNEFIKALSKPSWRQALSSGSAIIRDDYGLKALLKEKANTSPPDYQELVEKVKRLLEEAIEV
ncbi:MAG: nucleotidyltransferase domain-containing protein [Pyrodictiaceae archaeon]